MPTICVTRGNPRGCDLLHGACGWRQSLRTAVRSMLGFSFLVLLFSLFGGLLQCGGSPRRGVWGEARSRRQSHLTTRRSSMVSYPCLCIFHHLINANHLFFITYRCADVAVPLSHHGRCLSDHVHPIHRTRRHLRPLISRSFLVLPHALLAPIIDNLDPNLSLRTIFGTFPLFRLLRSRFLLTLLEASVIHPSVFIAYY